MSKSKKKIAALTRENIALRAALKDAEYITDDLRSLADQVGEEIFKKYTLDENDNERFAWSKDTGMNLKAEQLKRVAQLLNEALDTDWVDLDGERHDGYPSEEQSTFVVSRLIKSAKKSMLESHHWATYRQDTQEAIIKFCNDLLPFVVKQEAQAATVAKWANRALSLLQDARTAKDMEAWQGRAVDHVALWGKLTIWQDGEEIDLRNMFLAEVETEADELTETKPEVIADILGLVGVNVEIDEVSAWTIQQHAQVLDWASKTFVRANDNDVDVPEKPTWL